METTKDILEAKEAELSAKYKRKVTAHVFPRKDGDAVLFLKNPTMETKMMAWDEWMRSRAFSAKFLFDASAAEESDPRFFSGKEEDEALLMGAYMKAEELVEFAIEDIKKKLT